MARLRYLNRDDLPDDQKRFLDRPANLNRVLVHSPEAFRNFSRLGGWIRNGSTLDPRLREMAIIQVGYLTRCAYEYTHHIEIGRPFGVSDDDVRAVAADTAGRLTALGDLDRAVLRVARETTTGLRASDEAFAAVKAALSEEHVIDLLMTVAYYNLVVRMLFSLDVDLEPEYEVLLREFPFDDR